MNKALLLSLVLVATPAAANASLDVTEEEIQCLATNIYFESRNQSNLGKLAVGLVTLNRVDAKRWPNTICGVVKQAKTWGGIIIRNKCQFSWYCDGLSDKIRDKGAYVDARKNAIDAILWHNAGHDFVGGATHYHTTKVNPYWNVNLSYISTIDDHIFYK